MKRLRYYLILAAICGLLAWLPIGLEPRGGWGMAGLIILPYWEGLIGIFLISFAIYEMRHPPPEPIRYPIFSGVTSVAVILTGIFVALRIAIGAKFSTVVGSSSRSINFGQLFIPVATAYLILLIITSVRLVRRNQKFYRVLPWLLALSVAVSGINYYRYSHTKAILPNRIQSAAQEKTIATGNYEECVKLTHPNFCLRQFAERFKDPSYCERLPAGLRTECLIEVAMLRREVAVCGTYRMYWVQDNTAPGVLPLDASATAAYLQCQRAVIRWQMKDRYVGQTDEQITAAAVASLNSDICMGIANVRHSSDCELAVIKATPGATVAACETMNKFNADQQINDCYRFFGVQPPRNW